jgi:hypothetical protein
MPSLHKSPDHADPYLAYSARSLGFGRHILKLMELGNYIPFFEGKKASKSGAS